MRKIKRKQIEYEGTDKQIIKGNGELGELENNNDCFVVQISLKSSKTISKIVSEDLQCDKTAKEIATAILAHKHIEWNFLYEYGRPPYDIRIYPLTTSNIRSNIYSDESYGYECNYNCTLYHIDFNNNKQISIRCAINCVDYSEWTDLNTERIEFDWYYTDSRTICKEPPVANLGTTIGDSNLHDGFYFPNAVQDNDGNWYGAIVLGDQVWLAENLRTKTYTNDVAIELGDNSSLVSAYQNKISSSIPFERRGLFYNWHSISNIVSNTQDFIPNFHVPSISDFESLFTYLSHQQRYATSGYGFEELKSIASVDYWTQWTSARGAVAPGHNSQLNNKTNFNALPTGLLDTGEGSSVYFWTATNDAENNKAIYVYGVDTQANQTKAKFIVSGDTKDDYNLFMPIRCVSNLNPIQFRNWYIQQYGSLQHHLPQEATQVQADWNQTNSTALDFIKNKPNIPVNNEFVLTITCADTDLNPGTLTNATYNKTAKDVIEAYSNNKNILIYLILNTGRKYKLHIKHIQGDNSEPIIYVGIQSFFLDNGYEKNIFIDCTSNGSEDIIASSLYNIHYYYDVAPNWNQTDPAKPDFIRNKPNIPAVTTADNGKVLMVVNGGWALVNPSQT